MSACCSTTTPSTCSGSAAPRSPAQRSSGSTRRGACRVLHEVTVTDCQFIVTDTPGQALLDDLDLPLAPERIVRIDSPEYADAISRQSGRPVAEPDLGPATLFLLLFTSGTTGEPKAVRCTNGRIVAIGRRISEPWGFTNETVSYCCMPLFHGNALMSLWIPDAGCRRIHRAADRSSRRRGSSTTYGIRRHVLHLRRQGHRLRPGPTRAARRRRQPARHAFGPRRPRRTRPVPPPVRVRAGRGLWLERGRRPHRTRSATPPRRSAVRDARRRHRRTPTPAYL